MNKDIGSKELETINPIADADTDTVSRGTGLMEQIAVCIHRDMVRIEKVFEANNLRDAWSIVSEIAYADGRYDYFEDLNTLCDCPSCGLRINEVRIIAVDILSLTIAFALLKSRIHEKEIQIEIPSLTAIVKELCGNVELECTIYCQACRFESIGEIDQNKLTPFFYNR